MMAEKDKYCEEFLYFLEEDSLEFKKSKSIANEVTESQNI